MRAVRHKPIEQLRAGDRASSFTVVADAEWETERTVRVLVRHIDVDNPFVDYIKGDAGEEIPLVT